MLHYGCLHGKVIIIITSQMFSLLLQLTFRNEVSFNIECFKNIQFFSSKSFTISGAQLKEADY